MSRLPALIPVLDLLGGLVVHAVAGRRETYQPLHTPLAEGAAPLEVARALRDRCGCRSLYVADLDGILTRRPDLDALRRLKDDGFHLIADVGLRSPEEARPLLELEGAGVVAALETLPGPEVLAELLKVVGPERLVFSLDLRGGAPLTPPEAAWHTWPPERVAAAAAAAGVQRLLVLDLLGVGVSAGMTTLPLCRRLRAEFPHVELWTGGGVRDWRDVEQAGAAGVDAVLVSTALHAGRLGPLVASPQTSPR